jgi:hypothetical protein
MEGANSIEALSTKINQAVTPVGGLTFENASIPYVGVDNVFGGTVAGTSALNKLMGPVKGDVAVYAYQINKVTPAPAITDYSMQKNELSNRMCINDKKKVIKLCSDYVSSKLNNTPTVSKQSYMDNKLVELVMRNPYRIAEKIPNDKDSIHCFLHKLIIKLRNL